MSAHRTEGVGRERARGRKRRRGVTLPLIAVSLVGVCGFVALAVDVGRMAIARDQAQIVADIAAMSGARDLNGIYPQDLTGAVAAASDAGSGVKILGQPVTASNISTTLGTYRYDTTQRKFVPSLTLQSGEVYNLARSTVNYSVPTTFARFLGKNTFDVTTTATAAHRPRDVVVVLDYSASMHFESYLWNNQSYLDNGASAASNPNITSNNPETVYPEFGHYSNETNYSDYTNYANLLSPAAATGNPLSNHPSIGKSNVSVSALGVPPLVNDFWKNARGSAASGAFTAVPDSSLDANNQAGGDKYLRKSMNNSGQAYANTLYQVLNSTNTNANTTWEANGYAMFTGGAAFKGYVQGPRYWGKTFFIWPPDKNNDWRQNFFGTKINTKLWDSSGGWRDPSGNYTINYKAILAWIKQSPNPFPSSLRSGNILYYDAIPDDVPSSAYTHTNSNTAITNASQRFWKEYIDFVVGVWRDPSSESIRYPGDATIGYGPDYTFGTIKISAVPTNGRYMDYSDNPERPRHRFWFGPMTMMQYMLSVGILPGTAHDISLYHMKMGVGQALLDIQANHPNDLVSMILFSRPQMSGAPALNGSFNNAQFSLNNNYQAMIDALWVPPNSGSADVRPWDANGMQTPRARGNYDQNTASMYAFMLAYNQLSSSTTLRSLEQGGTTGVGGLGRNGATRLIIYETDGVSNVGSSPRNGFQNGGALNSYYAIQPGQTVDNVTYNKNSFLQVVQNICNKSDGTPGYSPGFTPNLGLPGYAVSGRPVSIQTIAFGSVFESTSSTQASSVDLLQQIAAIGGTRFPSSASDATDGYKWCTGSLTQRQSKLRQAFTNIMNGGVPISLIQ